MSVPRTHAEVGLQSGTLALPRASHIAVLRVALLAGCAASVAAAAWLGRPDALLAADPELARLLRGMALIKAFMVAAALALLLWRFGRPIASEKAAAYMAGTWLAAAGSMLIWQLTQIPTAAIGFHVGEIAFLILAWRDWSSSAVRLPR
jgi:hypothetical protein